MYWGIKGVVKQRCGLERAGKEVSCVEKSGLPKWQLFGLVCQNRRRFVQDNYWRWKNYGYVRRFLCFGGGGGGGGGGGADGGWKVESTVVERGGGLVSW